MRKIIDPRSVIIGILLSLCAVQLMALTEFGYWLDPGEALKGFTGTTTWNLQKVDGEFNTLTATTEIKAKWIELVPISNAERLALETESVSSDKRFLFTQDDDQISIGVIEDGKANYPFSIAAATEPLSTTSAFFLAAGGVTRNVNFINALN